MADLIKKIKIKKQDGTFTDYIPIGADAVNVSMNNGKNVQSIIGNIDVDRDGSIAEQLDKHKDYDSGIKTLKADRTVGYVYFYLEDMEDGTYVVKNISKEYPVSFLCYPELIKDKTDKTYNIYSHIMLHNNDILQLFKVGDNINDDTRIRHIPTNDSKITCFSIKEINEESDETSYSWNIDYIGLTKNNYSTSRYDTYNCRYLNGKLVNVGAEEDDNFKVNFIKSKNLYNPSYRASDGTIKSSGGTATEIDGVFTLVASANDSYFWQVTTENSSYTDGEGELYEFKKDSYTISLSNTTFNNNFITYYDANKVSLGYNNFGNSTFTINKSDKTGAKYFTIRFGIYPASSGTTYSTTIQLEEGKKASAYKPFVPSSIYVDNEKFTETIGVGSSVDSNYRVNVLHSSNLWHYNTTKTTNGVTSTYENSTITLNGTAIGSGYNVSTNSAMLHLNAGNYALKLTEISGTKPSGQSLIIRNVTSGTNLVDTDFSTTNTYTFALNSDADIAVMVYFWNNNVFDNYKFGVQLQEGSKTDAYKPYIAPSIVVDGEEIYTKIADYKLLGDFAVITGNYAYEESVTDKDITLSYPTGFTRDNCVVISIMLGNTAVKTKPLGCNSVMTNSSITTGAVANSVVLFESNIRLKLRNLYAKGYVESTTPQIMLQELPSLEYKVVLMKIPTQE